MNRLVLLAALVTAAIVLVVPATASADALVWHTQDCAFSAAGNVYTGSGIELINSNGQGMLQCHLSLASGSSVDRPTRTTIGNCELLEVPGGEAHATCRFQV